MESKLYTQRTCRKRVDLRLPELILNESKQYCIENEITFTCLVEMLLRSKLKKENRIITKEIIKDYSNIDVEDMPLIPKVIRIDEIRKVG